MVFASDKKLLPVEGLLETDEERGALVLVFNESRTKFH